MSQVTNQQTMQAAVWYAAKDLRVEQVPVPTISDSHEVKVKVAAVVFAAVTYMSMPAGRFLSRWASRTPLAANRRRSLWAMSSLGKW